MTTVGAPAAVASWRHASEVIARSGDPVMAPYLAVSTDGMLLAALVVIWVRRHRGEPGGFGPWAAFLVGLIATIAANLAASNGTVEGYVVALWPPICLAISLELVALIAYRTRDHQPAGETLADDTSAGQDESSRRDTTRDTDPSLDDRARELVAAGAGRPTLVKELAITDHAARELVRRLKEQEAAAA